MMPVTEIEFEAALAHQLRTPVSALKASAANLRRNLRGLLEDLSLLAPSGAAARTSAFLARALDEPAPPPITGLLPRDRIEIIVGRLQEAGLRGDLASIAASLLRGGWDTYMDEITPLLGVEPGLALNLLETSARMRAAIGVIEASLGRIEGLSAALRTLTCPIGGDPVDLAEGLEETAAMLRQGISGRGQVRVRIDAPPRVAARAELLNELWSALATNAVQAAGPDGTVLIEARGEGGGRAVVTFTDDGPGIAAGLLERIFSPGFTTRAADGGTGLGLSLARRIVGRLGGTLEVASLPGHTCFTVTLPAQAAARAVRA